MLLWCVKDCLVPVRQSIHGLRDAQGAWNPWAWTSIDDYIATFLDNIHTYNSLVVDPEDKLSSDEQLTHFRNFIHRICDVDTIRQPTYPVAYQPTSSPRRLRYYSHMAIQVRANDTSELPESYAQDMAIGIACVSAPSKDRSLDDPLHWDAFSYQDNSSILSNSASTDSTHNHPCKIHCSHSILPAAVSVLTARSQFLSHNLEGLYDTAAQPNVSACTLQVNLAESMIRMEDVNHEEVADDEKDHQE